VEISKLLSDARNFLFRRQQAYQTVLNPETIPAQIVLGDLAKFCRATRSTFHADPHMAARLDGRREVWLRISEHLNLTQEELWAIYGKLDK
jgi:hypothetical protein